MKSRHLISIADLPVEDIHEIFKVTAQLKKAHKRGQRDLCMEGKTLAMIFEKSSMRTRVSFEVAMAQFGGHAICLAREDIKLGERESVADVARVISRYVDGIMIRTFKHSHVEELAKNSTVSVINGLSDFSHPCQALADVYTMIEKGLELSKMKVAYVGDSNNVARSLALLCAKLNVRLAIASPKRYSFGPGDRALIARCANGPTPVEFIEKPEEAVKDADVVYTDVWASMGQETEAAQRKKDFSGYAVTTALLMHAKPGAFVMHCLPAHRGEEIAADVIDGPQSIVVDQAENRLHVQKAVLKLLMCPSVKS
jgi:ornithine carbamoyltransferase